MDPAPISRATRGDKAPCCATRSRSTALNQIGVPYKWGGASPETGFDCSGLMMWLWAQHGYSLPHFAASQYAHGAAGRIQSDLQIGDLVFFHELGHVGMYIGNGYVVHAPHTGDVVRIAPLSTGVVPGHVRRRHPARPSLSNSASDNLPTCSSDRCSTAISAVRPT